MSSAALGSVMVVLSTTNSGVDVIKNKRHGQDTATEKSILFNVAFEEQKEASDIFCRIFTTKMKMRLKVFLMLLFFFSNPTQGDSSCSGL